VKRLKKIGICVYKEEVFVCMQRRNGRIDKPLLMNPSTSTGFDPVNIAMQDDFNPQSNPSQKQLSQNQVENRYADGPYKLIYMTKSDEKYMNISIQKVGKKQYAFKDEVKPLYDQMNEVYLTDRTNTKVPQKATDEQFMEILRTLNHIYYYVRLVKNKPFDQLNTQFKNGIDSDMYINLIVLAENWESWKFLEAPSRGIINNSTLNTILRPYRQWLQINAGDMEEQQSRMEDLLSGRLKDTGALLLPQGKWLQWKLEALKERRHLFYMNPREQGVRTMPPTLTDSDRSQWKVYQPILNEDGSIRESLDAIYNYFQSIHAKAPLIRDLIRFERRLKKFLPDPFVKYSDFFKQKSAREIEAEAQSKEAREKAMEAERKALEAEEREKKTYRSIWDGIYNSKGQDVQKTVAFINQIMPGAIPDHVLDLFVKEYSGEGTGDELTERTLTPSEEKASQAW